MPVSVDEFEAMPVIPYGEARHALRTGDIVLLRDQTLGSRLIEFATHGHWSHAAFVWRIPDVNRVMLLESMDTVGVRMMPMSTRLDGSTAAPAPFQGGILVARHKGFPDPPDPARLRAMTQFALDRVGFPYSFSELQQIALRITLGMAGRIVTGRLDPKDGFICSEYVAKCFEVIGVDLAPSQQGFIAPADIARDPDVSALYSLHPDTT